MSQIFRTAEQYEGGFAHLNTGEIPQSVACNKVDLIRAMITVGNPSIFSWREIRNIGFLGALYNSLIEKTFLVSNNIQYHPQGLRRNVNFDAQISDKKRFISYNLGMAFAKFYAEKLFGIPHLIHLEFLKKQNAVTFVQQVEGQRPREPDLVGRHPNGEWHLFEAKGTSASNQLATRLASAKAQLDQVDTIHGIAPTTCTACATYIGSDNIVTRLKDPPNENKKRIEINHEKFIEAYYSPYFALEHSNATRSKRRLADREIQFFGIEDAQMNLQIGLETRIVELLKAKQLHLEEIQDRVADSGSTLKASNEKYSIGLDGFVVAYSGD